MLTLYLSNSFFSLTIIKLAVVPSTGKLQSFGRKLNVWIGDSEVDMSNIFSKIKGFSNIGLAKQILLIYLMVFILGLFCWVLAMVLLYCYNCQITVLVQVYGSGIENISLLCCPKWVKTINTVTVNWHEECGKEMLAMFLDCLWQTCPYGTGKSSF